MIKDNKLYKKIIIGAFLVVPILSSFISTVHVVSLFSLGNVLWMSIFLAVVFELGQLSSLLALAVLDKINKSLVWGIFILLALMQIVGNVYYTFDFIGNRLAENPEWLFSAGELVNRFTFNDVLVEDVRFYVSLIIGVPIPLIAVAFLKSLVDYLRTHDGHLIETDIEKAKDELKEKVTEEIKSEIKEEPKEEIKEQVQEEIKDEIKEEIKDKSYIEKLWSNLKNPENFIKDKKDIEKLWESVNEKEEIKGETPKTEKEIDLGKIEGKKK